MGMYEVKQMIQYLALEQSLTNIHVSPDLNPVDVLYSFPLFNRPVLDLFCKAEWVKKKKKNIL